MKKVVLLFFFTVLLVFPSFLLGQDNTYPTAERLFHIERSKNRNLVCYDVNLAEGKLDLKNPLTVYWVDREENPGETKGLNALQRRMAYGYKVVSHGDDFCEVTLSAYPGRNLLIRQLDGKYVCLIEIDNQQAILHSLYVKAKESNSLSVEYVELRGTGMEAKVSVSERVEK